MDQSTQADDGQTLAALRAAAELGPGYRGVRRTGSEADRRALTAQFDALGAPAPAYLAEPRHWIDRRAKLFEAGEYPDKGLTVTPEDLQTLASGFDLPVPILVEHAHSPLELGYLTRVDAEGSELVGVVTLTKEASDLVDGSGAYSLSLGISPDLSQIVEVSLVRSPRVPGARLFRRDLDGGTVWSAPLPAGERPSPVTEPARTAVRRALEEGRLVPAQAPIAEALLSAPTRFEFGEGSVGVASLVQALIDLAPPHTLFSEAVPDSESRPRPEMGPEEAAFYERYFPGISLDEISLRRASDRG